MRFSFVLLGIMLAALPAQAEENHFAPAKAGKLECLNPNSQTKTCTSIGRYIWLPDGTILGEWEQEISGEPGVSVRSRTLVTIAENRVCSKITGGDGKFDVTQNGKQLSDEEASGISSELSGQLEQMRGSTICISLTPHGDAYVLDYNVNGHTPVMSTQYMRWIDPGEGFTVGGSAPRFAPFDPGRPLTKPATEREA